MKANELMIGDYLRINRDRLCIKKDTIVEIRGIDANNRFENHIGCADCRPLDDMQYENGIWCDHLDPIPLTPEILEKNGFNDNGEGVYGDDDSYFIPTYQSGFDTGTWETHIEPDEGIGDFSGKLRYVHELQHTLRLCGIEKEIEL